MNMFEKHIKPHLTLPNMVILAFLLYIVFSNNSKIYVDTGSDESVVRFNMELEDVKNEVEAMKNADSIRMKKIVDYAKKIVQNNVDVDQYDDDQLDSAFASLTNGG